MNSSFVFFPTVSSKVLLLSTNYAVLQLFLSQRVKSTSSHPCVCLQ